MGVHLGARLRKTQRFCEDLPFRRQADLLRLEARRAVPRTLQLYQVWRDIYHGSARFVTSNHHSHHVLRTLRTRWIFGSLAPLPTLGLALVRHRFSDGGSEAALPPGTIDKNVVKPVFID
jgi:hypothetical protein